MRAGASFRWVRFVQGWKLARQYQQAAEKGGAHFLSLEPTQLSHAARPRSQETATF